MINDPTTTSAPTCAADGCGRVAVVSWRVRSEAAQKRRRSRHKPISGTNTDDFHVCAEHLWEQRDRLVREPFIVSRPPGGLVSSLATWVREEAFFAEIWMCDTDGCHELAVVDWIDAEAEPPYGAWPLPHLAETDFLACEDHYLPERDGRLAIVLPEPACNMRQTDAFGNAEEGCRRPAGPRGGLCRIHRTLRAAGIVGGF